ncbi:hypothetical protein PR202_ga27464 [Eleusine coracana subsp. coracana]|uniref:Bromo domain-containing protein n=1 Tax=Eleusine coracana subsp. coracana TaxID=191504 RepID=A0AAV5DGR9_ELECO|nr:hypothetical protein PR202_ga27464 [Eleusine coracana subsp. coracana]
MRSTTLTQTTATGEASAAPPSSPSPPFLTLGATGPAQTLTPSPGRRRCRGRRRPRPPPEPSTSRYVSIRVAGMTQLEARQAQARLTGELARVRALLARINTWQDGRRREAGPGPRRHASPTPPALRAAMLKRCGQILTRLRKQKISHWFHAPVDVEGLKLYDYRAIIRCPMDLGTVKENLAGGRYPSHEEFAADVHLTFNNALRYNPLGHQVHTAAGNLLASFEGMYKEAISWFEQEFQRLEPPMPLALPPPPPPQQQPVPVPVQAMPRIGGGQEAQAQGKGTQQEGDGYGGEGQKRNSDPALKGEDVELDFDVLDVETLWELDRFVLNWRKACSKGRQNVAMNGDTAVMHGDTVDVTIVPDEDDMVQVEVNPPIVVEIGESETDMLEQATEADMGDEYVDIGDEMPTVNYQSVEIEKDTQMASSSSESGSGSSASSDSGSRSSADSDSDGDDARSPD